MSGGTPEEIKPPPPPDPPPIPVVGEEPEEFALKEKQRQSGASKAFLTGSLTPKSSGKKLALGG